MLWRRQDKEIDPLIYSLNQAGWTNKLHNYYVAYSKLVDILDTLYLPKDKFGDFTLSIDYKFSELYNELTRFINQIATNKDYRNTGELVGVTLFRELSVDGKYFAGAWLEVRDQFYQNLSAYKQLYINAAATLPLLQDLISRIDYYLDKYKQSIAEYLNQPDKDTPMWLEYDDISGRLVIGYKHQRFLLHVFTASSNQQNFFSQLWNKKRLLRKDIEKVTNPSDALTKSGFTNTIRDIFILTPEKGSYLLRKKISKVLLQTYPIASLEQQLSQLEQIS